MTIRECYNMMDSDYDDVIGRLMNDKLVYKYAKKFATLVDYDELCKSLENKDYVTGFRMAHNLKGVSANLGFTALYKATSALCEKIRDGEPKEDVSGILDEISEKYKVVIDGISQMDEVI